jgi:hypothetical protein
VTTGSARAGEMAATSIRAATMGFMVKMKHKSRKIKMKKTGNEEHRGSPNR